MNEQDPVQIALAAHAARHAGRWALLRTEHIERHAANRPPPGAVVFYGTSTIKRWHSLPRDFAGRQVVGVGMIAAVCDALTAWYDELVLPLQPRRLVLFAGIVEAALGVPPDAVAAGLEAMCLHARARQPGLPVALLSLLASPRMPERQRRCQAVNARFAEIAARLDALDYIDAWSSFAALSQDKQAELFSRDSIHLAPEGYAALAGWVKEAALF